MGHASLCNTGANMGPRIHNPQPYTGIFDSEHTSTRFLSSWPCPRALRPPRKAPLSFSLRPPRRTSYPPRFPLVTFSPSHQLQRGPSRRPSTLSAATCGPRAGSSPPTGSPVPPSACAPRSPSLPRPAPEALASGGCGGAGGAAPRPRSLRPRGGRGPGQRRLLPAVAMFDR